MNVTQAEYLPPDELHTLTGSCSDLEQYILGPDSDQSDVVHCGIYALFSDECDLLYVGQSLSVRYRIQQHLWASKRGEMPRFSYYAAIETPEHLAHAMEIAHIHALKPPLNKLYETPMLREHRNVVARIRKIWEPAAMEVAI